MQEREQELATWKESERIRDNTLTEIFKSQLARWSEGCIYCRMTSGEHDHKGVCPAAVKRVSLQLTRMTSNECLKLEKKGKKKRTAV